jgi:hypothetical protein
MRHLLFAPTIVLVISSTAFLVAQSISARE